MSDQEDDDDKSSSMEEEEELVTTAPSLYQRPSYYRQTRKGKIIKTVQERYLRDDLGFGNYFWDPLQARRRKGAETTVGKPKAIDTVEQLVSLMQGTVKSDAGDATTQPLVLLVCDTNVLLHNLDVLIQALTGDGAPGGLTLVLPQTALQECRAQHMTLYDQAVELLRSVGGTQQAHYCGIFFPDQHHVETQISTTNTTTTTSMNDINDARLRLVAEYFGKHLQRNNNSSNSTRVIFLSDDQDSRRKAKMEQPTDKPYYEALNVKQFVGQLEKANPGLSLMDYVANYGTTQSQSPHDSTTTTTKHYFPAHLPADEVSRGVKAGRFHRGVFRSIDTFVEKGTDQMGVVTIRKGDERVAITIPGWQPRNRAMDGDVVAVALLPVEEWLPMSSSDNTNTTKTKPSSAGISQETAEPTHSELANVPDTFQDAAQTLRPTGKVVGILRRHTNLYSGSLWEPHNSSNTIAEHLPQLKDWQQEHADGSTTCIFLPVDAKVPPLLIRTTQRDRWIGQRLVVTLDSWPALSPLPCGHYTKTLGKIGDKSVETQVLLLQHHIPHEAFPASVLACLPPADYDLQQDFQATQDKDRRVDLRHLPILSIDPPGCTDIDDALHCYKMDNGNFQVGVHIADVGHYVKAGTAMDLEAANRATSTYLVDRRLDMLPSLLSTDLCSLRANVDRFAFSVLWEVTPDAQIVNVDFQKTLIHSIAALTYQEAQTMIDMPDTPENRKDKQVAAVKGLAQLARLFAKRRIDAGALTLASPEVKFVFDSESLNPTDVKAYAMLEANDLVMEFMLLANVTVGKKILRHYPTLSVLRRHPAPSRARFDDLISKAKSRGFELTIEDSKQLADSLDAAVIESDPYFNKLLRICATRCLSPAQYFCSGEYRPTEWHHYGLAAPVYTHFTSPIRRYADVCVHRLLAAAIGVAPLPSQMSSKSYMHDQTANMNRRNRGAQNAGRSSIQLHTVIFFGEGAKEEEAYVLDVETATDSEPSVRVIVPRYGIEGQVKLPIKAGDPRLIRGEHRISVEGSATIRVFDKVKVRIWVKVSPDHQRELILDLLEPSFGSESSGKNTEPEGDSDDETAPAKKKRKTT
ncbi:complex exonuclease RRP44 homolog A [Seminavis robusta]|uniref:Complex exonuclease RRP44 homolog A n=1 Tax=Seminavis robusta TaxID=568900 RepID=A0A9N8H5A2_9STRA|nr:complex exonuclease RRP44 homolog A [Seminavis robusta]|eukprot:Sro137_g064550.1 complex exonuclease RRP44 homolog A (1087) ;mRNA; r:98331-101708